MTGTATRLRLNTDVGRLLIATVVALTSLVALATTTGASGSNAACRVRNDDSDQTFARIQQAVGMAEAGDLLVIRGTCHGHTVIIDKDLLIEGARTGRSAMPRLDGGGNHRVLRVRKGATVTLRRLVVQHGQAWLGGGIWNQGTLVLRDVVVRRNRVTESGFGGGVVNWGTLVLRGRSSVRANTAIGGFTGPSVSWPSGGGVQNSGSLTLHDQSAITGNIVEGDCIQGIGGGLDNDGSVVLNDHSAITGNRIVMRCASSYGAKYAYGGGVNLEGGSLTLNDASRISRNRIIVRVGPGDVRLFGFGGGVYRYAGGSLTLNDRSAISHNEARMAGGVDARGYDTPLTMTGSSAIVSNVAAKHGGGILHHRRSQLSGVTCGPGPTANVRDNGPDDCYLMVWRRR